MNCEKNKINRSHSESDLNISQFDSLSVSSPRDLTGGFSKNSYSYSPIIRRVYFEEIFSPDENNFPKMRRSQFSEVIDALECSSKLVRKKMIKNLSTTDLTQDIESDEEVPMDIDTSHDDCFPKTMGSNHFKKPFQESMILDKTEIKTCFPQGRKARMIHINSVKKKEKTNKWLLFSIPISVSVLLYYFIFNNVDTFVNTDVQVKKIQTDLMDNVHGHKPLIDSIVQTLENRQNWLDRIHVLSFVGSQGVGKTFVANLIKKHFSPNLVHDIYGSHLYYQAEKQKIINGINSCCLNLIIIDDLKYNDYVDLYAFVHSLPKDSFILLLAIFNIHYTLDDMNTVIKHEDIINIRDSLDTSGIKNYELLVFEDFTQEQIKDWMRKQLHMNNISLPIGDEMLQNVLDAHNIKHGLKGLYSKMVLEFEKYKSKSIVT